MREWKKPQLLSLGIENTFGHYCHKNGDGSHHWYEGSHGWLIGEHKWSGIACKEHWTEGHNPIEESMSCCCSPYGTDSEPGQS